MYLLLTRYLAELLSLPLPLYISLWGSRKEVRCCFAVICFASVRSQEKHWDKTNKEITSLKVVISFVCLVPVHPLPSSMAVLYHVNDQLQRLKEAIVTFIIRTPLQSVITASVLSSSVGMYLSYVEASLWGWEREKRKHVYAGEDGKGKLLFAEARGAEQSR